MLLLCANHAYIFFSDPRSKEEKQSKKAKVETNGVLQAKLLNRKNYDWQKAGGEQIEERLGWNTLKLQAV